MKTLTNRTTKTVVFTRDYDDETGAYSYHRALNVPPEAMASDEALEEWAKDHPATQREKRWTGAKREMVTDTVWLSRKWTAIVQPGEYIEVPTAKETYAQSASRTGVFNPRRQYRRTW